MHPGELAHLRAETNRWALPLAPPAVRLVDSSPLQLPQVEAGPPAWQVGATGMTRKDNTMHKHGEAMRRDFYSQYHKKQHHLSVTTVQHKTRRYLQLSQRAPFLNTSLLREMTHCHVPA